MSNGEVGGERVHSLIVPKLEITQAQPGRHQLHTRHDSAGKCAGRTANDTKTGVSIAGRRILPVVATHTASCDGATVVEAGVYGVF
jgi:hypothetical protein